MKVILPILNFRLLSFPAKKEDAEPFVGGTQLPRPKLQLVVAAAWTQDMLRVTEDKLEEWSMFLNVTCKDGVWTMLKNKAYKFA